MQVSYLKFVDIFKTQQPIAGALDSEVSFSQQYITELLHCVLAGVDWLWLPS